MKILNAIFTAGLGAALAQGSAVAKSPAGPAVTLSGKSLGFGSGEAAKASFGMPKAKAIAVVAAALGKPSAQGSYPDCGQGIAIGYARFRGGLEITFIGGKFSGWALAENGSAAMKTARGVGLGTARAALKKAYPGVSVDPDSSLGVQFNIDDDLSGFLSNDRVTGRVTALQSGEICAVS